MQNKLSLKQIETIRNAFREHPLLVCCQKAFARYEADFEQLLFSPEEIFLESSIIIDIIKESPQEADNYLTDLWSKVKTKIRYWEQGTPQSDLNTASAFVLYVSAVAFCQHWNSFYSENISSKLLDIVRSNAQIDEESILLKMALYSENLSTWVNDYLDNENDEYLSEDIEASLTNKLKLAKKPKAEVKPLNKFQKAFTYNHEEAREKSAKLVVLYKELKNRHWIAFDTDQKQFLDIFLGGSTQNRIAWTTSNNTLRYLFDQWIGKGWLEIPAGIGKWQMVCSRFYSYNKKKNETKEFTEKQFKNADNPSDKKKEEADYVVRLLDPDLDFTSHLTDY